MAIGGLEGTDEFTWLADLPNLESLTIIDNTGTRKHMQCEWLDKLLSKVPKGMNDLTVESTGEGTLVFGNFTNLTRRIYMALPSIKALPDKIRIKIGQNVLLSKTCLTQKV